MTSNFNQVWNWSSLQRKTDALMNKAYINAAERLVINALKINSAPQNILDVGAGSGLILRHLANKNLNDFTKYYNNWKYNNGWGIKYLKQDLNLCKLVINDNKHLSYVNYKKTKLCLQIIKTYNEGFKYINKQYIQVLL